MSISVLCFILAMLSIGFFGDGILSLVLGTTALVLLKVRKKDDEPEYKALRKGTAFVAVVGVIAAIAYTALSIYNTAQQLKLQQAQYEQYYNQLYGTEDGGVDADGNLLTEPEASADEMPESSEETGDGDAADATE